MSFKHVALYLRKSTKDVSRGLDHYERRGRDYAERAWPGPPIVVYRESERGASAAVRDEFDRLMKAVDEDRVDPRSQIA